METIIAILFYLGSAAFGSTTTPQTQYNQGQADTYTNTQIRTGNSGHSSDGNIVINDNDKDN